MTPKISPRHNMFAFSWGWPLCLFGVMIFISLQGACTDGNSIKDREKFTRKEPLSERGRESLPDAASEQPPDSSPEQSPDPEAVPPEKTPEKTSPDPADETTPEPPPERRSEPSPPEQSPEKPDSSPVEPPPADKDSTLNKGDTSGDQAKVGLPGSPCRRDSDCKNWSGNPPQDAICLQDKDGFPGGYCTFMCSRPTSGNYGCNGYKGVYRPYSKSWGDGYCYHPCRTPKDCRVGYRCVQGACLTNCLTHPCKFGKCDPASHVCVAK